MKERKKDSEEPLGCVYKTSHIISAFTKTRKQQLKRYGVGSGMLNRMLENEMVHFLTVLEEIRKEEESEHRGCLARFGG